MAAKVLFQALVMLFLFPVWGQTQDQVNDQPRLSASTKTKIKNQMNESNLHSISVFTEKGDEAGSFPLDSAKSAYFRSLKDYVLSVQSDEEKEGRAAGSISNGAKPIISCKDPKALEPPPPCVICKDGTILCSKASFGMKVTTDEEKLQKSHPQE